MSRNQTKIKRRVMILLLGILPIMPVQVKDSVSAQASSDYADLKNHINEVLADERLRGAISAVSVRDADSGNVVFEQFGQVRLKIASNMKLLTGAAALEVLGPDYTFKTELLTDGKVKGNTLRGNLYLKGKGDSTLSPEDFDELAKGLKKLGIKKVAGNLAADDTWYDDVRLSEDVVWNDESYYYGAPISALTVSPNKDYDAGSVIIEVHPTKPGEHAKVTLTPETDVVNIVNDATTVQKDGARDITVTRKHGTNTILVQGTIPDGAKRTCEWIAVREPSIYALDLFRGALKREGIRIKEKDDTYKAAPENASVLLTKESPPLSHIFVPYMKLSNNVIAEMLVKEMGRVVHGEGSWEKGLEVVQSYLQTIGVNTDALYLRDGSGISHVSNVPASELSKLLAEVRKEDWYPVLLQSLPVAGASERLIGGTLRKRMKETAAAGNVKAKTGTITGATSLAGYVTTKGGQELAFAVVLNNFGSETVKDIEDRIAVILAEYNVHK
ncbi:D-alanyl-D-alanine carboxypeptidase/D-alanyl-D-alanine endopeptidase [Priestia abyssalis]|uniref:D-alanyl-D-alanine carboxypeptidase/D-alanyl-D-alanine endopeptidase n=1 Tax=Priestia abyssalis TaxID=1221450 RepID=UPI000994E054|nr:D-alanyl-D-alanine carboxypeptidase/D-alanyl-D-alanine-endopeptidase [Priestia abyssalis]